MTRVEPEHFHHAPVPYDEPHSQDRHLRGREFTVVDDPERRITNCDGGLDSVQFWQPIDPASIPRPKFVYGDVYAAGYLTVTVAAPKTGKSLQAIAEAVDAATGRGFLTGQPSAPQRVAYINAEDDEHVIKARIIAQLRVMGVDQSEIAGRLIVSSGVSSKDKLVLIKGERNEINEAAFRSLERLVKRTNLSLIILDPLQDLSQSPETNDAFRALGARIRQFAADTGVAVGLIHHTRKLMAGASVTLDDGRGGSSLRGIARFNRALAAMTEAEGAEAGVDDHRRFFRIAEVESNLAPPSSDRNKWLEKLGVEIGNGGFAPAIKPWKWPDTFAGLSTADAYRVRAAIAASEQPLGESVQAQDWAGHVVANVLGLDVTRKADKARIKSMLKKWIANQVLAVERLPHGNKGNRRPFVVAGPVIPGGEV